MSVEYRVLGPVEALVDGVPVKLGGPRQRGVLVALLTRANSLVPAARVIDDLWEDDPPSSAANLVQGYVSHLRKALGRDAIETRGRDTWYASVTTPSTCTASSGSPT